jgi:membrane protein YdbS with pleckstrin-like domain
VIAEPTRQLAPSAYGVWALQQGAFWIVATIVVLMVTGSVDNSLVRVVRWLPLVGLALGVTVVPLMRYRRWRWDVDPDALVIRHGTFNVRQTVVPMVRVQHVDTTSHLLEQAFDLATVEVHTAAGSHKIPLLTDHQAYELRTRIAELAGTDGAG